MALAIFVLIGLAIAAGCCAVMVGPTIGLTKLGQPKIALAVALASTAALVVDYLYNWEQFHYPHWLMGAPTWLFPLTFLAGACAISFALKEILDQMY